MQEMFFSFWRHVVAHVTSHHQHVLKLDGTLLRNKHRVSFSADYASVWSLEINVGISLVDGILYAVSEWSWRVPQSVRGSQLFG